MPDPMVSAIIHVELPMIFTHLIVPLAGESAGAAGVVLRDSVKFRRFLSESAVHKSLTSTTYAVDDTK